MDFSNVIATLNKQMKLYNSLYQICLQKTEIVKKGEIEALNQLMTNEQKHVTTIAVLENERINEVQRLFQGDGNELPTISQCIEYASGEQKQKLQQLFDELSGILAKIKQQNDLNQELITSSLQFVNFSLNLLRPKLDNYNYGPNQQKQAGSSYSIFNSKV